MDLTGASSSSSRLGVGSTTHDSRRADSADTDHEVLIADKFETERDRRPDGRRLRRRLRARPERRGADRGDPDRRGADVLVVRGTQGDRADARRRPARADRARRRRLQHDRRGRPRPSAASTCRTVPGKNAIAVAELAFALILALDRRMPENVADLRAGQLEQEGILEGAGPLRHDAGAARRRQHRPEMIRRAAGFGMPS